MNCKYQSPVTGRNMGLKEGQAGCTEAGRGVPYGKGLQENRQTMQSVSGCLDLVLPAVGILPEVSDWEEVACVT